MFRGIPDSDLTDHLIFRGWVPATFEKSRNAMKVCCLIVRVGDDVDFYDLKNQCGETYLMNLTFSIFLTFLIRKYGGY